MDKSALLVSVVFSANGLFICFTHTKRTRSLRVELVAQARAGQSDRS